MKQREIIITEDGSSSLYIPALNEHYHSVHGAIQESMHIFIQAGIEYYNHQTIHILEAGFGTGLNCYLTLLNAQSTNRHIIYHTYEKYPLTTEEINALNYPVFISPETQDIFHSLHGSPWEEEIKITPYFTLYKHQADFTEVSHPSMFDIVFFDAFAPEVQPHLWTIEVLQKFYEALKDNGIFVTYCVKGIVKQRLRDIGFKIKRLPGPPGKREILRATKISDANDKE